MQARSHKELTLLLEISRILDQNLDLREVLSPVLEALAMHLGMHYGTISLLNRKTSDIFIELAHGLSQQQTQQGRYKLGEGVTGQVVLSGKPAIIPKTSESSLFLNKTQREEIPDTSFICVPIKVGKEVVGALSVDRPYDPEINLDDDVRFLKICASMIAQAVKLRRAAQEERDRLAVENERLRAELRNKFRPSNIIGNSKEMQLLYDQIAQVSKSMTSVLIEGETGTGKEHVAHALHYNSDRSHKAFIKAHCAALPESIIESELFGHEKGAFTGATTDRKGRFELAHGGTLFLDEIGELSSSTQIKLLRVLQEKEFERVGGTKTIKVNVRLLTATNKDLRKMVLDGEFREDLFYRLYVFPIYVPPLNKRKSDIVLLADYFLEKYANESNKNVRRLSSTAIDMLMSYHWPGNVRELENCMERAILLANEEVIYPHHLPPTLQTAETCGTSPSGTLNQLVKSFEHDIICDALKSARGNIAASSRALGTTQRILGYKIKQHQINAKQYST